ncbi:MAG: O-antigen ligase family protein [Alphaproteobacteria bacterium]|nr:O-antigen ligase family protein [Alphaproteobacteria bacterium]
MLLGKSSACQQLLATDKFQARLVFAALYLLLLLPLAMIYSRVAADIIGVGLGVLLLVWSFRARNWSWLREPPVVIALILWAYSVLVVSPFALDPGVSFARAGWIRFILLFAAIAYWLSSYHEELRKIAAVMLGILLLAGADALYQYCTGFSLAGVPYEQDRLTGPFKKVVIGIYLAKLAMPVFGILLYSAWKAHQKKRLAFLALALVYCFGVVLLSNERTATFTLALGIVLVGGGVAFSFRQARLAFTLSLVAFAALIAVSYQSLPSVQKRVQETEFVLQEFSQSDYGQLWKASFLLWQEHPIIGVGMMNFRLACPTLLDEGRVIFCSTHSHNIYLEMLSEYGGIGLLLMLLLVTSLVMAVVKSNMPPPRERCILTFFAAAGLLINFFPLVPTQSFFSNWPALLAWQSIAWSIAITRAQKEVSHV